MKSYYRVIFLIGLSSLSANVSYAQNANIETLSVQCNYTTNGIQKTCGFSTTLAALLNSDIDLAGNVITAPGCEESPYTISYQFERDQDRPSKGSVTFWIKKLKKKSKLETILTNRYDFTPGLSMSSSFRDETNWQFLNKKSKTIIECKVTMGLQQNPKL